MVTRRRKIEKCYETEFAKYTNRTEANLKRKIPGSMQTSHHFVPNRRKQTIFRVEIKSNLVKTGYFKVVSLQKHIIIIFFYLM